MATARRARRKWRKARAGAAAPAVDVGDAGAGGARDARAASGRSRAFGCARRPRPATNLLWVAGEVSPDAGRADEWGQGATADLQITAGGATAGARVDVEARRSDVRHVRSAGRHAGRGDRRAGAHHPRRRRTRRHRHHPHSATTPQPLFYRRGPTTANRQVPTADLRFTRADRVHLELPVGPDVKPGTGRMLDRNGQPTRGAGHGGGAHRRRAALDHRRPGVGAARARRLRGRRSARSAQRAKPASSPPYGSSDNRPVAAFEGSAVELSNRRIGNGTSNRMEPWNPHLRTIRTFEPCEP